MDVDFSKYFWGEKHNGFDVLYQNMKFETVASKELSDFFKDRSTLEENNVKIFNKLARQIGNNNLNGTFSPMWQILKTSIESIACIHSQMIEKIMELFKESSKYSEDLHKKHKLIKEHESTSVELVQSMQHITVIILKARDYFLLKAYDYEKLKKDSTSPKEVEKAHTKFLKSREDYQTILKQYKSIRNEFEQKMSSSCKNFQLQEECHLNKMKEFLKNYANIAMKNCELISKAYNEFLNQCNGFTNEKLLKQFCQKKTTGQELPDISDCPTTLDLKSNQEYLINVLKQEEEKCTKTNNNQKSHNVIPQETDNTLSNQEFLNYTNIDEFKALPSTNSTKSSFGTKTSRRTISLLNLFISSYQGNKGNKNECPNSAPPSPINSSSVLSSKKSSEVDIDRNPVRGSKWFLRSRKTKGKKLKKNNSSNCDNKSDLDESEASKNNSSLKESLEIGDDGFSIKPEPLFDSKEIKNGFSSDSDTDSEDEKNRKIHVEIKPLNSAQISASVDELRATVSALSISPYHKESSESSDRIIKRSQSVSQNLTNNKNNDISSSNESNQLNGFNEDNDESKVKIIKNNSSNYSYMSIPRPPSRKIEKILVQNNVLMTSLDTSRTESVNSLDRQNSYGSVSLSRTNSPLSITFNDAIPLAIAFEESIDACFRGTNESNCIVKMSGVLKISFPSIILHILVSDSNSSKLSFNMHNVQNIRGIIPTQHLLTINDTNSTNNNMQLDFDMENLTNLLKEKFKKNPNAVYFNIDILKYRILSKPGAGSCPLQLVAFWKCEQNHTDLKIDYKYNSHALTSPSSLTSVLMNVQIDGFVKKSQSMPALQWKSEENKAYWFIDEISSNSENNGIGSIRARFEIEAGPSIPRTISTEFLCYGAHLSGIEFQLNSEAYRISLLKHKLSSGEYTCDGDLV